MRRRILTFILAFIALPAMAANMSPLQTPGVALSGAPTDRLLDLLNPTMPALDAACCKFCSKGQPCGDTCISRDYTCNTPPGCACWAP